MKKKILLVMAAFLFLGAIPASAQKQTGMRLEVAESETDHGAYSIFTYRDEDGTLSYYMSLARTGKFLGGDEILGMEVKNNKETIIRLGGTTDEAFNTIDSILDLFDKDLETTAEFQGRAATSGEKLGAPITTQCIVVKKPLGGKRLEFTYTVNGHQAHTFLTKSTLKELRRDFKLDVKLHPKQHVKK